MSAVLSMFNHLLAGWLARQEGGQDWRVKTLRLDAQGGELCLEVEQEGFCGELLLRLVVESSQGQRMRLRVAQWPATVPEGLAPLIALLEQATLWLELDAPP